MSPPPLLDWRGPGWRDQTVGRLRDIRPALSAAPLCSRQSFCIRVTSDKVAVGPSEAGEGIGRRSHRGGGVQRGC